MAKEHKTKQAETEKEQPQVEQSQAEQNAAQEVDSQNVAEEKEEIKAEPSWEDKYNELNNSHLRLMADFDNYRKRTIREKADIIKNASEKLIIDFLPIIDNFERALKSMQNAEDVAAVREGVELIYNQLMNMLKTNGVAVIETEQKELDTNLHDAIAIIPAPTEELKGKIIDCTTTGYTMNDKVIRHAKVVVGQ